MKQDNITTQVVSYESAMMLRKLGFKIWCEYLYTEFPYHNDEPLFEDEEFELKAAGKESEIEWRTIVYKMTNSNSVDFTVGDKGCSAPEISVVLEWLRLNHNMIITYEPVQEIETSKIKWASRVITIKHNNQMTKTMLGNLHNSLSEALEENIKIVLTILLQLKKDE